MKITGRPVNLSRVSTGLYGLDHLMMNRKTGELGYPLRTITEIYGPPSHGKSTFAQYLAGTISVATEADRIDILDVEGSYEQDHLESNILRTGFDKEVHMVDLVDDAGNFVDHEVALEALVTSLTKSGVSVGIIDSLGAVMSKAEVDNPIGSANWGQRAKIVNQTMRKGLYYLRANPKTLLIVNHQYENMGGVGYTTPGGMGKTFAAANRISVWRSENFADGSHCARLRMDKLRYGGMVPKSSAQLFITPGFGVIREMTAVMDAAEAGLVERTKTGFIKIGGKSIGRIGKLIEYATTNPKPEVFDPVFEVLQKSYVMEENNGE